MDKAKNIENLIKEIADSISIGCCVRYDLESLEYGELHRSQLDEYGEYIDMAEFSDDVEGELLGWEIDEVMRFREICNLPDAIEPPRTIEQIGWMVDFANNRSFGTKFVKKTYNEQSTVVIHLGHSRMLWLTTDCLMIGISIVTPAIWIMYVAN